ncbi:hypothetical protein A3G67_02745 [Candidatus Roizmanbacteria bacterium RIFCSPLOWO2_12_FULL_40_12]|uniref:Uncharacterized protein n=1 Tax=Candidatus Roizmanbacteria bacterium RIFCSPLOWO2_01_FULL_40_42 TaxID=1802066 RepID=A0A1F7J2L8_9BACT|nr:MAG: hypothetical protein A2779_00275 [Candidatus Roizmanbacteria bacterium RIFCSPHIGHO2_01_FULL_40_98]OGK27496.1 MAG: hypothetical protein A3C31_03430 [Candidatus Roizmanbacteria bacterium RIFCSPHIGHO2_02_FULL_40_53]OGK36045.1 MAG: hypothetical protein A3E69_04545 [Candidatus Roizmanbacteria bacterium RIFCSPHIGHO2_12_FULL_40_130]OGK49858.1 MAG: hypothetical protein A3B50_03670 [Candidatus Roizmanbacteria bacterium RIFCSPLOWO2_01_FULL_40_42]OGK59266.1 MAG: hypothetical protein A3H84_04765 [C
MSWDELRQWVNNPLRSDDELRDACNGLALDNTGSTDTLRNTLLARIAREGDLAAAATWNPAAAPTAPVTPAPPVPPAAPPAPTPPAAPANDPPNSGRHGWVTPVVIGLAVLALLLAGTLGYVLATRDDKKVVTIVDRQPPKDNPRDTPRDKPSDNGDTCASAVTNAEGYPGPTTQEAKEVINLDVQRLGTECSAFVFRDPDQETHPANCPDGWVCTFTLADGGVKVYQGEDGLTVNASAGTLRFVAGYPSADKVHEDPPCELARAEDSFGQHEDPSFPASAGNFNCNGSNSTDSSAPTCPTFAGLATTPIGDGGCKYKGSVVTDVVPNGWTAHYWDGSKTVDANPGATITTGESSFYPVK